ncbi:hypothetical protein N7456_006765 [Penicillium angulare]|uniref:Uncharacterized protein n=1 Tax=Penicillium angulare TaxID=116970 RepID=A0A9W9FIH7_9EURO|nr:hypothetical protein N7456_006765 [Penicillium angulare]
MHQGIVGSADQVMKNAGYRDQYATDYDIICFEMEVIGVMETTSCITVRGISDYSDGHKNDDWHSYASLSAAVCAKELLKIISIQSLSECPMEITQDEPERSVKGAVYQVSCSIHQSPGPQKEYQMAQRNHDTIVERYGFVQDLIVPNLYELTQGTSSSEDIEHARGRIAAMEILQQDLEKSLDSVRSQVRKQAKRRQNSDVMRQNWKTLRYKVDSSARWVAEVSKVTHHVLANTASKSRRFFISAGKKGNRTFQDAGHAIQDSSLQAIEHLKHLMEHFKIHFLAHRKKPRVYPNEGPPKYSNEFENIPIPELSKSSLQYDVAKSGQWSESSSSVESMGMDEIRHFPVSVRHPPSSQQLNVDSIEPVFSSPSSAIIPRQASNFLPPPPSSPPPPPPSQQPVNNSVRDSSDLRTQPKERPLIPPPRRPGINAHRESEDGRSSTDAPSMSSGFSDDAERHGSAPTTPSSDDCTLVSPSVSDLVAKWQTKKSVMGRPRFEQ